MGKQNTSSFLGAHAEAQFISYALENGWEISIPFNKIVAYDFVIRRSPEVTWETVQVKRAYYALSKNKKRRFLEVGFRRSKGRGSRRQFYKDGDFDWLFTYHKAERWFMPWDLIKGRRSSIMVSSSRYDLWKV